MATLDPGGLSVICVVELPDMAYHFGTSAGPHGQRRPLIHSLSYRSNRRNEAEPLMSERMDRRIWSDPLESLAFLCEACSQFQENLT